MRILGVGTATLDLILRVDSYPAEDSEIRAETLQRRRGGNATNTLTVLSELGHHCAWAGCLADEPDSRYILDDLERFSIDSSQAVLYATGKTPTSYIWSSSATASRTIVHYRDLPEYPASAFTAIDLNGYDWVHFEGRAPEELGPMLMRLKEVAGPRSSLEIEKPREGIEKLFPLADVLLFSSHYARHRGYQSAEAFLQAINNESPAAQLFCAWGAQGAAVLANNQLISSPAFPPETLVETLAAGDVFNGGVIHSLATGRSVTEALTFACQLAGKKCGQHGIAGLSGA